MHTNQESTTSFKPTSKTNNLFTIKNYQHLLESHEHLNRTYKQLLTDHEQLQKIYYNLETDFDKLIKQLNKNNNESNLFEKKVAYLLFT